MPYTVTAVSGNNACEPFIRKTAAQAIATAADLIEKGMKDVCITDAQRRQYAPADFNKLLTSRSE